MQMATEKLQLLMNGVLSLWWCLKNVDKDLSLHQDPDDLPLNLQKCWCSCLFWNNQMILKKNLEAKKIIYTGFEILPKRASQNIRITTIISFVNQV
jgi:hypothetical protein